MELANEEIQQKYKRIRTQEEHKVIVDMQTNLKAFFAYANKNRKIKSQIGPLINKNGKYDADPKRMANILNQQYKSVFTEPTNTVYYQDTTPLTQQSLTSIHITEERLSNAMKEINPDSAPGPDHFPAIILHNHAAALAKPMLLIWQRSLDESKMPWETITSIITPIHKGDDKGLPENYRPVALTSHLIKTFEKLIKEDILMHLQNHNLLNHTQHGFRPGRATISQLLNYHHSIITMLQTSDRVESIYLDFAKAFDKVNHDILRQKLEKHNIKGKLLQWIMTFLRNRKQAVRVEGKFSDFVQVKSGVPQGSVLGPILFTIMMYDIDKGIKTAQLGSFADDTRIWAGVSSNNDLDNLQHDLDSVYSWAKNNGAPFNNNKIVNLTFGKNAAVTSLQNSTGMDIETLHDTKDLGITLSDSANFNEHITKVAATGRQVAGWARRTFQNHNRKVMLTLLKTLITPKLEYCCPLWSPADSKNIKLLESVQQNFTRHMKEFWQYNHHINIYICNTSYWERLKILNLYSLQRRRERYLILYMFKILNGFVPNPGMSFTYNDRTKLTAVKEHLPINTPTWIKTLHKNSFFTQGAQLYNILPRYLRQLEAGIPSHTSITSFKTKLDIFLHAIPDQPGITGTITSNSLIHQVPNARINN